MAICTIARVSLSRIGAEMSVCFEHGDHSVERDRLLQQA